MARTANAPHWSGFLGNSERAKTKRAIADMFLRVGLSQDASKFLVDDGLATEGDLENCAEIGAASKYIKNVRKPGGGGDGHHVSTAAEGYFTVLIWAVGHYVRVS